MSPNNDTTAYMQVLSEEELDFLSKNNWVSNIDPDKNNCRTPIALITDTKGTYQSISGVDCCCASIQGIGYLTPQDPFLAIATREYAVVGVTDYFYKFIAYKDGVKVFESVNYSDLACPSPDCITSYTIIVGFYQLFNGCAGDCKFIFTKFYRKGGQDIICDTDEYSFYWSRLPGWPPCI